MSALAAQQEHYKAVRARLLKPKNAWRPKLVTIDPEALKAMFKEIETPQSPQVKERETAFVPPIKKAIMEYALRTAWTYEEIIGPGRNRALVEARFDCIAHVRRKFPSATLTQLGRSFNKDHTSILHSLRKRGFYPQYGGAKKDRYAEAA